MSEMQKKTENAERPKGKIKEEKKNNTLSSKIKQLIKWLKNISSFLLYTNQVWSLGQNTQRHKYGNKWQILYNIQMLTKCYDAKF